VLGNISCHAWLEFDCQGIDVQRLEAAVKCVQARHPMLRASFNDGRQRILGATQLPVFDHQDWRHHTQAVAQDAWHALREWRSHECLAVDAGQVLLVGLVQLPEGRDRVWLSVDLLAVDVESLRLLMAQLGQAYQAPAALAPVPDVQFADYLGRRANVAQRRMREIVSIGANALRSCRTARTAAGLCPGIDPCATVYPPGLRTQSRRSRTPATPGDGPWPDVAQRVRHSVQRGVGTLE